MKKLALIALLVSTTSAFASNSYCETRPAQRDKAVCYKQAIEGNQSIIRTAMGQLKTRMTAEQFKALNENNLEWTAEINNRCIGDVRCLYDSTRYRGDFLNRLVREHSANPKH